MSGETIAAPAGFVPDIAVAFAGTDGRAIVVSAANPLPVSGGGGGGAGAAVTIIDGGDATLGSKADPKTIDPAAAATAQSILKGLLDRLNVLVTASQDPTAATVDTVIKASSVDRGALVGTVASTLMPANAARRGFSIQNQSQTATLYFSGIGAATADYHSFQLLPGGYFETSTVHAGTGVVSIISDTANTPVFSREF